MSDKRKTLTNVKVEVNGTCIHFDGKFDPETNQLKIYEMRGDVSLFGEAIQNYAIDNKIEKVLSPGN